ncbi:MAG: hypothetical protein HYY26_05090 [Acidobacteria bacterium]|nr:hypothetical protein [Acidobacteriota bacterium]
MKGRAPRAAWWLAALLLGASAAPAETPRTARALLEKLQGLRLDTHQAYKVTDLYLRRDALRLNLRHGTLIFLEPIEGRVTGAIFDGAGEILIVPPDRPERQQMLKFTGSPILTETFNRAYFRFSDNTAEELRAQIAGGRGQRTDAAELAARWAGRLPFLDRLHAQRLLLDFLDPAPRPYFYAAVRGERLRSFDVVVDERRPEQVQVGQVRATDGVAYYDVWTSFSRADAAPAPSRPRALSYQIDATFSPAHELEVTCEVELELGTSPIRVLTFELSRFLMVEEVAALGAGEESRPERLEFFQNVSFSPEEARHRGSDLVAVALPEAATGRHRLRFRYRGRVIADLGSGVLHVGARESWYPRPGVASLAHYCLRFRYPRRWTLVAVGRLRESREEGEWKESVWQSEVPLPVAGFNLGDYEAHRGEGADAEVTIYAHRELEPRLLASLRPPPEAPAALPGELGPRREDPFRAAPAIVDRPAPAPPPAPTEGMARVGKEIAAALGMFSGLFGEFPYGELKVSQSPGLWAQGYPGLIYLPTFCFLSAESLGRLNVSEGVRQHYSELVPAHETAHQWWGNWVQTPRYRDQWLAESLAAYSALLFLERQENGPARVREWLERYRRELLKADADGQPLEATGALALGLRLDSSRSPDGYVGLIYKKGPWVIHMLRELFRDSETGSEAAFFGVLRALAQQSEEPLTTAAFQRALEAALPAPADVEQSGRLDWFFEQWVYQTGIPRYRLRWQARRQGEGAWAVEGTIEQSEVPDVFLTPLPVFARWGREQRRLGTVVATGPKVDFRFAVPSKPDELLLDPHLTVLRRAE